MRFNIKNWQDKHLIKESKLKEMDFKDKAAFDKYQSKHNMRSTTKVSIAGKDTTAGEAGGKSDKAAAPVTRGKGLGYGDDDDSNVQFDLSTNKNDVGDGLTDEDKLLNGLDAFRDGLIDKDEWDDIRDDYDEDGEYSDEDGYGEKEEKPAPENDKPWEKSSLGTDKSFKKTPASEKRKYFSFNPVDGGKFTHGKAMPDLVNGLRNSDASNEESIQNLESTLKAAGVYDLKTVDKKDAIKAIEDVDQSVDAKNDMKKHVENIWDKDHQAESVTPRSTRIQEAKMYQTIQELKGLEKGL
tara:strand:+ start:219 stop:1109 length:891 start_codon:yes stop_codon:yes gene_type:complete